MRCASKAGTWQLPITPFILLRLLGVVHKECAREVMVFAAMLVAFGAFLRKANVCAASRSLSHIQRSLLHGAVRVDSVRCASGLACLSLCGL
jgi:hypothetical protein